MAVTYWWYRQGSLLGTTGGRTPLQLIEHVLGVCGSAGNPIRHRALSQSRKQRGRDDAPGGITRAHLSQSAGEGRLPAWDTMHLAASRCGGNVSSIVVYHVSPQ